MAIQYQESAGILVYYIEDKKPRFLLLKYPTYWGFAKGIIEKDESIEQTAKRELEEETCLKNIEILPGFRHVQEWFFRVKKDLIKKKATYLLAKVKKEQAEKVKISSEHDDFTWLSYEGALEKMKIKNNKEMLTSAYELIEDYEKQKKLF